MILALPDIPAMAQNNQTVLGFDPLALGLKPETQGTVNVVVKNVQNLYGIEFQLAFDPNILEVVDANAVEEGVQIKPADRWKNGFVAVNKVDNGSGRIDFAATLLRPALPASGDQTIVTITFAARKTGTSALSVESAILSTRNAEVISFVKQAGKIGVSPSGNAPTMGANAGSSGPASGRLALAGAAILAFVAAVGVFIYALRSRR